MTADQPHLLAVPDKFRGTATAAEAADAMKHAAEAAGWTCDTAPIADGGEGLLDCLGGANRHTIVTGPLGAPVTAGWRLDQGTAVIEMSAASGMTLAHPANDPLTATTRGTGQLITAAIIAGATEIIVGAGGSATTDGGLATVEELSRYAPLDGTRGYRVVVAVDVATRFTDAARVFGPQKGADADQVDLLEQRLRRLIKTYHARFGIDLTELPGGGAAGGLAGGLAALGATVEPGFALVARHLDLEQRIAGADLVITGEGKLDDSTLLGKGPGEVARICHRLGIPVAFIVGTRQPSLPIDDPTTALDERFGTGPALLNTLTCIETAIREVLHRMTETKRNQAQVQ